MKATLLRNPLVRFPPTFDPCFNDHLIAIPRLWVLRPLRSLFTTKEADFEVAIPKVAIYVLTEVRQGGCGR